jgi:hypothetical protein
VPTQNQVVPAAAKQGQTWSPAVAVAAAGTGLQQVRQEPPAAAGSAQAVLAVLMQQLHPVLLLQQTA